MFGRRGPWPYLVAAAGVLVLTVVAVLAFTRPDLVLITPAGDAGLTVAGQITLDTATPAAGQPVTAHITISADRPVVLRGLTVQVRDQSGTPANFPARTELTVGPLAQRIDVRRAFDAPGTYTYCLAYRFDGDWISLPPWYSLTVG